MKKVFAVFFFTLILLIVTVAVFIQPLSNWTVNVLWIHQSGYFSVHLKMLLYRTFPFLFVFILFNLLFRFHLYVIKKIEKNFFVFWFQTLVSLFLSVYFVVSTQNLWLKSGIPWPMIRQGFTDPVFRLDAYWYFSLLPVLMQFVTVLIAYFVMIFLIDVYLEGLKEPEVPGKIALHFSSVLILFQILISASLLYMMIYVEMAVIQPHPRIGIGHEQFYGLIVPAVIYLGMIIVFSLFFFWRLLKGSGLLLFLIPPLIFLILYPVFFKLYPSLLNEYVTIPNELELQKPFAESRIKATREAFGLKFVSADYIYDKDPDQELERKLKQLRVWDTEPYRNVVQQVQTLKTYFDFPDVDLDSYTINGEQEQVLISAREMNLNNLSSIAWTWDNIHLRYTHGYGAVISRSHQVDQEGGPVFALRDLDLQSDADAFYLDYPQIYFGELTTNYIITRTSADEFEYTLSTQRVTTYYEAEKGIPINPVWMRLLYAVAFHEKNIFFTDYFNKESRILYYRNIYEMAERIFPYFHYEKDAYPVIENGRIYWVIDAYTISSRFPLAQKYETDFGKLNYIRNSVKVLIDAYTGEVTYYLVDEDDPVAAGYRLLFPELFENEIPEWAERHFHYPLELVNIQSSVLQTYHVENPETFYNGDDIWNISKQIYGNSQENFNPYYVMMRFKDYQNEEQNILSVVQPFSPRNRDNLASWILAYYDDGEHHLVMNRENRSYSAFGPLQFESRINQDDDLSSFFTLWGQKGSEIFRGNVKFVPVYSKESNENSLLYIEPIFLESEHRSIPQLIRIVGLYNDQVYSASDYDGLREVILEDLEPEISAEDTDTTAETAPKDKDEYNQVDEQKEEPELTEENAQSGLESGTGSASEDGVSEEADSSIEIQEQETSAEAE